MIKIVPFIIACCLLAGVSRADNSPPATSPATVPPSAPTRAEFLAQPEVYLSSLAKVPAVVRAAYSYSEGTVSRNELVTVDFVGHRVDAIQQWISKDHIVSRTILNGVEGWSGTMGAEGKNTPGSWQMGYVAKAAGSDRFAGQRDPFRSDGIDLLQAALVPYHIVNAAEISQIPDCKIAIATEPGKDSRTFVRTYSYKCGKDRSFEIVYTLTFDDGVKIQSTQVYTKPGSAIGTLIYDLECSNFIKLSGIWVPQSVSERIPDVSARFVPTRQISIRAVTINPPVCPNRFSFEPTDGSLIYAPPTAGLLMIAFQPKQGETDGAGNGLATLAATAQSDKGISVDPRKFMTSMAVAPDVALLSEPGAIVLNSSNAKNGKLTGAFRLLTTVRSGKSIEAISTSDGKIGVRRSDDGTYLVDIPAVGSEAFLGEVVVTYKIAQQPRQLIIPIVVWPR